MNLKELKTKKILIINHFGIGDVFFTTPLISNLRANFPDVYLGYLCNRRVSPVLLSNSNINKVFIYDRDDYNEIYKRSKIEFFKKVKILINEIKNENFDVVFDFSLNSAINFLTLLTNIKVRIGFNYKNRSPLLTVKYPFTGFEKKHVVEYYLDLLEDIGCHIYKRELELYNSKEDSRWAEDFLRKNGVTGDKTLVGILPGAGASWGTESRYRRWSVDKYKKLVDKIIEKFSVDIILMGDKNEETLCSQIVRSSKSKVVHACGKTSIGQLSSLIARCNLVILNDGGPLHIAVAAKTKTISIFGPVNENIYGPYVVGADNHLTVTKEIPCRPCYKRFRMPKCDHISCLKLLTVEDVFRKVEKFL